MSGPARRKDDGETFPTICPRCHTQGKLGFPERPGILQVHLKADGTIEKKEASEHEMEFGLTCPKCHEKYWERIEFVVGMVSSITVSTSPTLSMSDKAKEVKPVEVFYSKGKRWWFSKRGGKEEEEIGPGEHSS